MVTSDNMQQWAYLLSPTFQFINSAGKPLTEGWLEVYIAGTRNKYYCSSDFNGTLHPFQIPLDSLGANIVLADPSQAYDVYAYNKFGSLIMSRYHVTPVGAGGSSSVLNIVISSEDGTVTVNSDGNGNFDLSIKDTVDRVIELEDIVGNIETNVAPAYAIGHADTVNPDHTINLINDAVTGIDYLQDMTGYRLKSGHVYQFNFNAKFDCGENNQYCDGKFYIEGDSSIAQEWKFTLDDSYEHSESFNGSTVLVTPSNLEYYDIKLKYAWNEDYTNKPDIDLNKISIVDVTSIILGKEIDSNYSAGSGILIDEDNVISVDMDYINSHLDIDATEIVASAVNIATAYTNTVSGNIINYVDSVSGDIIETITTVSGDIIDTVNNVSGDIINTVESVSGNLVDIIETATGNIPEQVQSNWTETDNTDPSYIQNKPDELELVAGQNIGIFFDSNTVTIAASATDLSDYATHSEVSAVSGNLVNYVNTASGNIINYVDESIVSAIDVISGIIPEAQVQSNWTETDNTDPSYIQNKPVGVELVAGQNIGIFSDDTTITIAASATDLSNYATHSEVINSVTSVSSVLQNEIDTVSAAIPVVTGFATVNTVNAVSSILEQEIQTVSAAIPDVSNYATHSEVNNAITTVTGLIPTDYVTHNEVSAVSGNIVNYVNDVSGNIIEVISEVSGINQVYHDDTLIGDGTASNPLGIEIPIIASGFDSIGTFDRYGVAISSPFTNDWTGLNNDQLIFCVNEDTQEVNHDSIIEWNNKIDSETASSIASAIASSIAPAQVQSNWTETDNTDPSYIQNKPTEKNLVAGDNISISVSGSDVIISASGASGVDNTFMATYGVTTFNEISTAKSEGKEVYCAYNDGRGRIFYAQLASDGYGSITFSTTYNNSVYYYVVTAGDAWSTSSTSIPNSQVQSNWIETDTSSVSYIQNKPTEKNLVAGNNISITVSGTDVIISASGSSGSTYNAGSGINIVNDTISVDTTVIPTVSAVSAMIASASGSDKLFIATYIYTNYSDVISAYNDGKYIVCRERLGSTNQSYNFAPLFKYDSTNQTFYFVNTSTDTTNLYEYKGNIKIITVKPSGPNNGWSSGNYSVNPDWLETNTQSINYIQNKPDLSVYTTQVQVSAIASAYASGGGGSGVNYEAGDHIDITDNTISVTGITELVAGNAITITASGASAIISSTGEAQVQSDWNVTDSSSKAYIRNKPSIPAAQIQSDWNQTNTSSKDYIKNKPTIKNYTGASGVVVEDTTITLDEPLGIVAGSGINIVIEGDSAIICVSGVTGGETQVNADWTATSGVAEILNKPTESNLLAGSGISFAASGSDYIINAVIPTVTLADLNSAGITDIQLVTAMPQSPVSGVLYLIPEA